jgi:hypothetical protein
MPVDLRGDLRMHVRRHSITAFFPFLQKGFGLIITPSSILDVLVKSCALDPEEIRSRIQTLFLNGKPVDDMADAHVQDGDHLALSAAMPGLVGATMRSGGALAGFRHSISHRSGPVQSASREGLLTVKLFNLLIRDLGPRFLEQGVLTTGDDLNSLMTSLTAPDRKACYRASLGSKAIDIDALAPKDLPSGAGLWRLQVTFDESAP